MDGADLIGERGRKFGGRDRANTVARHGRKQGAPRRAWNGAYGAPFGEPRARGERGEDGDLT